MHWQAIEADLHERYGIDVDGPADDCAALTGHTWRWFQTRVLQLLWLPDSRLSRLLFPPTTTPRR